MCKYKSCSGGVFRVNPDLSIRSTYIADRTNLENAEAYNGLLIRIMCFSLVALIIVGVLIFIIKRK
mgnify:CR=1 FL=1